MLQNIKEKQCGCTGFKYRQKFVSTLKILFVMVSIIYNADSEIVDDFEIGTLHLT